MVVVTGFVSCGLWTLVREEDDSGMRWRWDEMEDLRCPLYRVVSRWSNGRS